jgi:isochorismate synthase
MHVEGFGRDRARQLERAAARHGALHASEELVVCAFGRAVTISLDGGLADVAAPARVRDALEAIELDADSDDGPGGSGVLGLGSLPFDATQPTELFVPTLVCAWQPTGATAWITEVGESDRLRPVAAMHAIVAGDDRRVPPQRIDAMTEVPEGAGYAAAVEACVARIRAGDAEKVVLARRLLGRATEPIDVAALARALHVTEPSCTLYAFPHGDRRFVGASPELLVATNGGAVAAHPLAGTVSLATADATNQIEWLRASTKNLDEHRLVVDDIVARLSELCDAIGAPATPEIVRLTTVAHLGTWIDGKLAGRHDAHAAMRALAAVHPTPAVGGVPREAALDLIRALETGPRGPWAGPVGWVDADGTSTWTLGLRGLCIDGDAFEAWGGAGIVADSEPESELDETTVKLESVLRAFSP